MALTRGDDFPIHQTAEPIAFSGTDRNFYDRYFFNGYHPTLGADVFAVAFGVYPHLNIADAAFVLVRDGVETALHASRILDDRLDLSVGPIRIEVLRPLQRLRITVDAPDQGLKADMTFDGRAFPIEEPRFIRRTGTRAFMDYTRMTQNGRYEGWVELDGLRTDVGGFIGTRDRSWGVRPVGARDSQDVVPAQPMQFYWLWAPANFEDGSLFFHSNEDSLGRPWNSRAVWMPDGAGEGGGVHLHGEAAIVWRAGTRQAASATLALADDFGKPAGEVKISPVAELYMLGLGYTHPKWTHGALHGPLAIEREDIALNDINKQLPFHLHVQALSEFSYTDASGFTRKGRGVLEQLVIGPHRPSGFTEMLDFAK